MASQAEVDLVISTADTLPELERELTAIIRTAEGNADDIDLQASLDRRESVGNLLEGLRDVVDATQAAFPGVELTAELDTIEALQDISNALDDVIDIAEDRARTIELDAELAANEAALNAELAAIVAELERSAGEVNLEIQLDRDRRVRQAVDGITNGLGALGRGLGSIAGAFGGVATSAAKFGAVGAALIPVIAGVAAAVQNIAPASAVAATGLLTVALASGTVKLAMQGVGEAVSTAFDPDAKPEDLAKAMERLSPAARSFVKELSGMRKGFKAIQQSVQENVFQGLDQSLRQIGKNTLPVVAEALQGASGELNAMALKAGEVASEIGRDGTLGRALKGSVKGLENLNQIPAQIVQGLAQLAAAAAPAFERLTKSAGNAAKRVSDRLAESFRSGALEKAIDNAIKAVRQLGRIFGNVFEGIGNIFEGFQTQGEGLFGTLEKITQAFADLTASKEFQDVLGALVTTVGVLVDTALPLLMDAFKLLAPVILELAGPVQELIKAFGQALEEVFPQLAPVLLSLAEAFGTLLIKLAPVIIEVGKLIAFILEKFWPIIQPTIDLIVKLVSAGFDVLADVIPRFVIPALEVLVKFLNGDFKAAFEQAKSLVTDLGVELVDQTVKSGPLAEEGFRKLARVGGEQMLLLKNSVVTGITTAITITIQQISKLPGEAVNALRGAGRVLVQAGADLISGFINGIRSQLGELRRVSQEAANSVTGAIKGALFIRSPSRVMMKVGSDTMEGFRIGIHDAIPDLRKELHGVAAMAPSFALPGGQTLALPQSGMNQPVVQVYLGNQLLDQHIDTRITTSNQARDRLIMTGVRR